MTTRFETAVILVTVFLAALAGIEGRATIAALVAATGTLSLCAYKPAPPLLIGGTALALIATLLWS